MKPQINARILIWPYVWGSVAVSVLGLALAIPTHGWTIAIPVICLPLTLFRIALLAARKVYVTDRSVCIKAGIISRDMQELSLRKIESVELHQGLAGRLFGYGRIRFHGTGASNDFTPYIKNPAGFRQVVSDRSESLYQVAR